MVEDKKYELIFHGRGGQGAVTAAELLCEFAYVDGMGDVLSIPIIGAERRGAPIKAFVKLSTVKKLKDLAAVTDPDISIIFDMSLLHMPGVLEVITHGIVILNTSDEVDLSQFPKDTKVYAVDATTISLDLGLVVSGSPILNVPLLGAYAKIMGHIKLESMEKILVKKFGSKAGLNFKAAQEAFGKVKLLS